MTAACVLVAEKANRTARLTSAASAVFQSFMIIAFLSLYITLANFNLHSWLNNVNLARAELGNKMLNE